MADIARGLEIAVSTVCADLKFMREEWREAHRSEIAEHIAEQLAKLDLLEQTYWFEWEESRQPSTTTIAERLSNEAGTDGDASARVRASRRTEQRTGNPSYLAGVQWCITTRCAILGILGDKPGIGSLLGFANSTADPRERSKSRMAAILAEGLEKVLNSRDSEEE